MPEETQLFIGTGVGPNAASVASPSVFNFGGVESTEACYMAALRSHLPATWRGHPSSRKWCRLKQFRWGTGSHVGCIP